MHFPLVPGVWLHGSTTIYNPLTRCLTGDLSNWGWDDKEGGMGATTRPLGVEVYQLNDTKVLEKWREPESPKYTGMHGLRMPPRPDDGSDYVGQ